jgi:hypothetical protein
LRESFPLDPSVGDVLADPKLTVFSSSGAIMAENDNWSSSLAPYVQQVGAVALSPGSLDSALLITLPPGLYTAQLSASSGPAGLGLIEVFDLDP